MTPEISKEGYSINRHRPSGGHIFKWNNAMEMSKDRPKLSEKPSNRKLSSNATTKLKWTNKNSVQDPMKTAPTENHLQMQQQRWLLRKPFNMFCIIFMLCVTCLVNKLLQYKPRDLIFIFDKKISLFKFLNVW